MVPTWVAAVATAAAPAPCPPPPTIPPPASKRGRDGRKLTTPSLPKEDWTRQMALGFARQLESLLVLRRQQGTKEAPTLGASDRAFL